MNASKPNPLEDPHFCDLVTRFLEDQITANEVVELNAALRASQNHQDAFLWMCLTQSAVMQELEEHAETTLELAAAGKMAADEVVDLNDVTILPAIHVESDPVEDEPVAQAPVRLPEKVQEKFWTKSRIAAGFLLPVLMTGVLWYWLANRRQPCEILATVDAQWDDAKDVSLAPHSILPAGEHKLTAGMIKLSLGHRFAVVVQGPADFEILSDSRIRLSQGKLCARAIGDNSNLIVVTPDMTATDLGTEFAVSVMPGKASHLEVFQGHVNAAIDSSPGSSVTLGADQAVRVVTNSGRIATDIPTPVAFIRPSEMDAIVAGRSNPHVPESADSKPDPTMVDIGSPQLAGQSSYDGSIWKISSDTQDTWNNADECTFICKPLSGNCSIGVQVIQAAKLSDGSLPYCGKAGIMFRPSMDSAAPFVDLVLTNERGLELICRTANGELAQTTATVTGLNTPVWLKLTRLGDNFTGIYSLDGVNWKQVGACSMAFPESAQAGVLVTSATKGKMATGIFAHASWSAPSATTP